MEEREYEVDIKCSPFINPVASMCRCCLSTEKRMYKIMKFSVYYRELSNINISESDGLPQSICYECHSLLWKSYKFKSKIQKAHTILNEYLERCTPFPIDAQDTELSEYATSQLHATNILMVDSSKSKLGFHKVLQHEKRLEKTDLDKIDLPEIEEYNDIDSEIKVEHGYSDFDDDIAFEEFKNHEGNTDDDINQILITKLSDIKEETEDRVRKRKKCKKTEEKTRKKKKKIPEDDVIPETEAKSSLRKPVEVDPTKIRVIILDPAEQIKQREEESKASFKFPYHCKLCYKGFNFESKLQNHMTKHSPSRGKYKCNFCHMHLPTAFSLAVHMHIHSRRYECMVCGRRMIDKNCIIDHYRTEHEGLVSMYSCDICGKISKNHKTLLSHIRNIHSGERPKCDQCGKTFVNKDSLSEHLQIHLGISNYECPICQKKFRTRSQIKSHQLKHSASKDFYCVECDVRFKSSNSLRQHLQRSLKHRDMRSFKYPCDRCDKRFDTEARLRQHSLIQHMGVRAHSCSTCGAALASASSLAKHVRIHEKGEPRPRNHVCDTCGRAFTGKNVLINHVRTHTGEKPFECVECGRKFTQRTAMRTHHRLVHMKLRRKTAKIKPELSIEPQVAKIEVYKEEGTDTLTYNVWPTGGHCDVFYRQTAAP